MTQRCVGWSIIGRPCQSSSMIIVGTEIARTRSADPTMSAQPGDRSACMSKHARSAAARVRGSGQFWETAGTATPTSGRIRSGPRTATTRD